MNVKLINVGPEGVKQEITLDRFPTVIGRGAGADIRIDDRWLSRRHCQIEKVSATLVVRDLGSKNGTLVNRVHVSEGILMPGDKLTIGTGTFVVLYEHRSESLTAVSGIAEVELVGPDEGDNTATFNED
jgi:pSer/pThr/pTyr-binding forkhead associated (FHA) protein